MKNDPLTLSKFIARRSSHIKTESIFPRLIGSFALLKERRERSKGSNLNAAGLISRPAFNAQKQAAIKQ